MIKGNINMNWTHFRYFSKRSLKLNTVALQLAVWLRVACCYVLSQIYWLHQLHQTSKFASSSKMYIFWYRLIGLLQATYIAHETKYWLSSCWNRVLGSSLSLRIIVKASCRCSTCLELQTNLNLLSPHTIKTINL